MRAILFAFMMSVSTLVFSVGRPQDPVWREWKKNNATDLDIRKALLECGAPNPHDHIYGRYLGLNAPKYDFRKSETQEEEDVKKKEWRELYDRYENVVTSYQLAIDECMVKNGFQSVEGHAMGFARCDEKKEWVKAACAQLKEVPIRSVERRVNGWYCKSQEEQKACKEAGILPKDCNAPPKEYDLKKPTCLP